MISRKTLTFASAGVAMLLMTALIWQTSSAAFTAQTAEDISIATGTIALTDDNASASFSPTLWPGDSDSVCITVTYDQTPVTPLATLDAVRVYVSASAETNGLGDSLQMTVSEATGPTCTSPSAIMAVATVNTQASTYGPLYANGVGTWTPTAAGETQAYLVAFDLPTTAPDSAQGGTVDLTLTWEIQTS
ncbi:MAG: hypothetical protein OEM32_02700 [Acidimicrobiia bacterium]|nr:hypothetical protein [Acidimicrobiia bacterium]